MQVPPRKLVAEFVLAKKRKLAQLRRQLVCSQSTATRWHLPYLLQWEWARHMVTSRFRDAPSG